MAPAPSLPRRVVVVGGGAAGLAAVQRLRADGYDGDLTMLAAERHLPYSRPPLSKAVLAGTADPLTAVGLRGADSVAGLADVRLGRPARALDLAARTVVTDDGELVFDALLIASGVRARTLAIAGADLPGLHVLRTLDDCLAIRAALRPGAKLVVVGAGFIGCEVAATTAALGYEVTIVDPLQQPLMRLLGAGPGERIAELHRSNGVQLRLGAQVEGFTGTDRVEGVRLGDGTTLAADLVVVGVGAVPDTDWLTGSGLALGDGVLADEFCEASAPGVFVAGDVARFHHVGLGRSVRIEHWTNAGEQGAAAASNLLRAPQERVAFAPLPYVWSDQHGRKIQIVGFPDAADDCHLLVDPADATKWLALLTCDGRAVSGVTCGLPARLPGVRAQVAGAAMLPDALQAVAGTLMRQDAATNLTAK